jgi:hypothetical protein
MLSCGLEDNNTVDKKDTLLKAAKAAGYEIVGEFGDHLEIKGHLSTGQEYVDEWNSFDHDDDCFRLETALEMNVDWYPDFVAVGSYTHIYPIIERFCDYGGDKDKARRYASTKAAALIITV